MLSAAADLESCGSGKCGKRATNKKMKAHKDEGKRQKPIRMPRLLEPITGREGWFTPAGLGGSDRGDDDRYRIAAGASPLPDLSLR